MTRASHPLSRAAAAAAPKVPQVPVGRNPPRVCQGCIAAAGRSAASYPATTASMTAFPPRPFSSATARAAGITAVPG
jgi:hypothetical protein